MVHGGNNDVEDKVKDKRIVRDTGEIQKQGQGHQVNSDLPATNPGGFSVLRTKTGIDQLTFE